MRISDWSSDVCSSDLRTSSLPKSRSSGCASVNMACMSRNKASTSSIGWPLTASVINDADAVEIAQPCPTKLASCTTPSSRSEEHTSELQSLMRISYAVFCLQQKNITI